MLNDTKILDVHSHVSHPMQGMGRMFMFMQAANMDFGSPFGTPAAEQSGLGEEAFAAAVDEHIAYIDERNIDAQVLGPRPFLMMGWMQPHLLPGWTRLVNDAIHEQCKLHPDRFLGASQLPQDPHAPDATHMLEELRRTVDEYGFVGVYVSPDPDGRRSSPGMADRYWYPLYEECSARSLPIVVHGTNTLDRRVSHVPHNYQLGFVAEQYWAGQILSHSDVFEHFPALRVLICHCGGALDRWIPTDPHLSQKDIRENIVYDTCAHDVHYLEAAIKQRGVDRMCFGTEAPGSGRAVRPDTGRTADDLVPVIDAYDFLSAADKTTIFQDNPAKLFPRLAELG
jgi:predicted TIM-barrel fold metal-dependent hydrolase